MTTYLSLNPEAQKQYQRLYLRKYSIQREDKLELTQHTYNTLLDAHLLEEINPNAQAAMNLMNLKELKSLCKVIGIKSSHLKKADLCLAIEPYWTSTMAPPMVWLSHKSTFKRACRWYTCLHEGDITRIIVQDLGHRNYLPTHRLQRTSLFASRLHRRLYETFLTQTPFHSDSPPDLKKIEDAFELLKFIEPVISSVRFSPLRRLVKLLHYWALALIDNDLEKSLLFTQHIPPSQRTHTLLKKSALKLYRDGQGLNGLELLKQSINGHRNAELYSLLQTYNTIATRLKRPRRPFPYLRQPRDREVTLKHISSESNRPLFQVGDAHLTVEAAVCCLLNEQGHFAIHAEGQLWSALLILLFWDAYIDQNYNQLPSPVLTAPLDYQTDKFSQRRLSFIQPRLLEIENGQALSILKDRQDDYKRTVRGLGSKRITFDMLERVCDQVDGKIIASLMKILLFKSNQMTNGMPDLVIIPNPNKSFDNAFPNKFRNRFLLAELKTPADTLSPSQRLWFHSLETQNIRAEIWNIVYSN